MVYHLLISEGKGMKNFNTLQNFGVNLCKGGVADDGHTITTRAPTASDSSAPTAPRSGYHKAA